MNPNGEMMTLLEAMRVLGLRRADLEPSILQRILQDRLETAEFEEIPRLLTAYRTITRVLDQVPSLHIRNSERHAKDNARSSKGTREDEPVLVLDDAIITSVEVLPRPIGDATPPVTPWLRSPTVLLASLGAIAVGSAVWAFWPQASTPAAIAASKPSAAVNAQPLEQKSAASIPAQTAKSTPTVTDKKAATPAAKPAPKPKPAAVIARKPDAKPTVKSTAKPVVATTTQAPVNPKRPQAVASKPSVQAVRPTPEARPTRVTLPATAPAPKVVLAVRPAKATPAQRPIRPNVIARRPANNTRTTTAVTARTQPARSSTANAQAVAKPAQPQPTPNQIIASNPKPSPTPNANATGRRAARPSGTPRLVRVVANPPAPSKPEPVQATPSKPAPVEPVVEPVVAVAPITTIEPVAEVTATPALSSENTTQRYFNERLFSLWQRSGATLRYENWANIPLEIQLLESGRFREAVYLIAPPATEPKDLERPN